MAMYDITEIATNSGEFKFVGKAIIQVFNTLREYVYAVALDMADI